MSALLKLYGTNETHVQWSSGQVEHLRHGKSYWQWRFSTARELPLTNLPATYRDVAERIAREEPLRAKAGIWLVCGTRSGVFLCLTIYPL